MEKLKKYITQVRGITYKKNEIYREYQEGLVPILKANNLTEDGLEDDDLIYISREKIKENQFIKKGDILLAASSGSKRVIGKNISFKENYPGSFGAFCKVVRPKNIFPFYLKHFFKSPLYRQKIESAVQGANINNLKARDLDDLELLVPKSLDDQKRIAQVLTDCEELIGKRKESITLLDELLRSTFLEMFGDPGLNNKEWDIKKFEDIFDNVIYGTSTPPKYVKKGIPFLRATNVKKGTISEDRLLYISEKEAKKIEKCKLKEGNIIMVRSGANTGDSAYITKKYEGAYGAFDLIISINKISGIVYNHLINSEYGKRIIKPLTRRAAQPHINSNQVKNLEFYYPPFKLQEKFAQLFDKVEEIKELFQNHLNELENLYRRLSQDAFKGELDVSKVVLREEFLIEDNSGITIENPKKNKKESGDDDHDELRHIGGRLMMGPRDPVYYPEIGKDGFYKRPEDYENEFESKKKQEKQAKDLTTTSTEIVKIPPQITAKELAMRIGVEVVVMMAKLIKLNITIKENQLLSNDIIEVIGEIFGQQLKLKTSDLIEDKFVEIGEEIDFEELESVKPEKLKIEDVSSEFLAELIKNRFGKKHFSMEMLIHFFEKEQHMELSYYSSEDLKKKPYLNEQQDLKKFIFSAIVPQIKENPNPFLKIEQVFFNSQKENFDLRPMPKDYRQFIKEKDENQRTGIYFKIVE